MLWFLLFGLVGFGIYKLLRRRWYRSMQKQISTYQDVSYRTLPPQEKKELKALVNKILDSGISLDDETNRIVTPFYQEMEEEEFYAQNAMQLRRSQKKKVDE